MDLLIHVDRKNSRYYPGQIIQLDKLNDIDPAGFLSVSPLNLITGLLSESFIQNLQELANEGLSKHGRYYLEVGLRGDINFNNWAYEMLFENVRANTAPDMPSRFQSMFAWADESDAIAFQKKHNGVLYRVEALDDVRAFDMNLLSARTDLFGGAEQNARAYWSQEKSQKQGYEPKTKVVMKCPIKIVEQVKHAARFVF